MPAIHDLRGPAGRLEALLDVPKGQSRAAVVFAHPLPTHGGTMHTKAVFQGTKGLVRAGCAVLRFNFRGVGRSPGTFDGDAGEKADFRAALDFMTQSYPDAPLWAAGMSFGSWIGLSVGADDPRVSLLLGVSTPVTSYDFGAVAASAKPKCFIHGEGDEICSLKEMREFYARAAEPKELAVIDAADHLFDGKVSEVADAVEDLLGDWSSE